MSVKVVFSASDALFEGGQISDEQIDEVELGPFDFVQVTYDVLRDDRGNTIATFVEGLWVLGTQHRRLRWLDCHRPRARGGPRFSDLVVCNM